MGTSARQDAEKGRAAAAALLDETADTGAAGLAGAGPEAWTAFDEEVRTLIASCYPPPRGGRIEARLCDRDGRVREAALSGLSGPAAEQNPPPQLVLIRCADWVPQVRERARRELARIVTRDPVAVLVDLGPLIVRLGRREHGAWAVEQLETALSGRHSPVTAGWHPGRPSATWSWHALTSEQCADALARLGDRADLPTRRFAARLTVASGQTGVRDLALRAARELDPATARLWTDAALRAMAEDATEDAALIPLLDDPWPAVAREAALSLSAVARRLDHRHLAARIAPERPLHVRRAAFRLLSARGGIHELRAAVALSADGDPGLRMQARATVRGWNWQATLHRAEAGLPELAALLRRSEHLYERGLRRSRLGLTG
ncbi:hypothetical protein ACFYM0_22110 [Streptomyces sp. NPDC006487]|uniref:hypothetical protein n=1 Tax=Streptomyces sp. NPDC006487 TaxID=3364748 RepID=UPI003698972D